MTDVSVQQFGDTAILTGILTTKSPNEDSKDATMVVFARSSGKWKVASAQWTPVESGNESDELIIPVPEKKWSIDGKN